MNCPIELRCECHDDTGLTRARTADRFCGWCNGEGYIQARLLEGITPSLDLGPWGSHYITEEYSHHTQETAGALADTGSILNYARYCAISAFCWLGAEIRDSK